LAIAIGIITEPLNLLNAADLWSAKKEPSLRSVLHEAIFMMQAAEYGPLHNPAPDGQCVSVLIAGNLLRHGLKQTRT
jgi:hypothetical protein